MPANQAELQPKALTQRIAERAREFGTHLGLELEADPYRHPLTHPDRFDGDYTKSARALVHYFQAVVEATSPLVASYTIASAGFERLGIPGLIALAQLLANLRGAGIPVILDAKRSDVGAAAQAYAGAYLGEAVFAADAVTVTPWLGFDSLGPFVSAARKDGRAVVVVLKSGNAGSGDVQELQLSGGEPVWEHLAARLDELSEQSLDGRGFSPVIAAVAGSREQLQRARQLLPSTLLIVPSVDPAAADIRSVAPVFAEGGLALVNASGSLAFQSDGDDFPARSREAVMQLRDEVNALLD